MAFVGREVELEVLERELALAFQLPGGRSVFVQGPSGAGKTTLTTEFLERVAAGRPDVAIARGRCLQTFRSADPYLPFVEALRDLSDETESGRIKKETLSEIVTELAPYWLSVVPMVGSFLSAGFATAARLRGQAMPATAASREVLFIQYLELIRKLSQQAPLILLLDDLHWADHASVALLNHLSRGIAALPVLIVGTLRPDEAEMEKHPISDLIRELEREGLGSRIVVGELEGDVLTALLRAEFQGEVSEPLRRWMEETAGGNPLFATELARLLKQSRTAVEVRGEWHLTDAVRALEVPRSAEAVIETRIQRLEPEEIRILQYASVEGNVFDSVTLARLLEQDELDVLDALERIERRYQLIRTTGEKELPDGDLATTLQFRHALVQTVLYRQVLGKRRVLLHRKAGEILESLFSGAPEAVAGRLARHFHQGRLGESAHRYAYLAADAARRVYGHWEAEEFYRIALEHSPTDATTTAIHERLGDVYHVVGYFAQGIESFGRALERTSDPATVLRLRRKITVLERKAGLTPVPTLLQRIRALIEEAAEVPQERCLLLLEIAHLPGATGVTAAAEEAVRIATSLEDACLLASALEQLAMAKIYAGEPQEAVALLERAFTLGRAIEDPVRAARCHNIQGIAHYKLGQYRNTLQSFELMLEKAEQLADAHAIAAGCTNIGATLLALGEYDRAEEYLERAKSIHQRRDRATLVQSLLNLAKRAHWSGDLPAALERYREMLDHARELEYWTSEAVAHAGMGLCSLGLGRVDDARQAAWAAMAVVADRDGWFEDREFVEILLAQLHAADGTPVEAAARLARAAAVVAQSDLFAWTQIELERAQITRRFDPATARAILETVTGATQGLEFAFNERIRRLQETLDSGDAAETRVLEVLPAAS